MWLLRRGLAHRRKDLDMGESEGDESGDEVEGQIGGRAGWNVCFCRPN